MCPRYTDTSASSSNTKFWQHYKTGIRKYQNIQQYFYYHSDFYKGTIDKLNSHNILYKMCNFNISNTKLIPYHSLTHADKHFYKTKTMGNKNSFECLDNVHQREMSN